MLWADPIGQVANTSLPTSRPLLPLFEAVVNSIHAIEFAGNQQGRIDIHIERNDDAIDSQDFERHVRPILNFVVTDNGVGFTDENLLSFQTANSLLKQSKGGKGVGRFIWLKAFNRAWIESVYKSADSLKVRTFSFELSPEGVVGETSSATDATSLRTVVRLEGFKDKYRKHCPVKASTIAHKIVEHCLTDLMTPECPMIILHDGDETINLNGYFKESVAGSPQHAVFDVGGHDFALSLIRLYSGEIDKHTLSLCANNREVETVNLGRVIPDLVQKLVNDEGNAYYCLAALKGSFLDEHVASDRTEFKIPGSGEFAFDGLNMDEIIKASSDVIRAYLGEDLQHAGDRKLTFITRYITEQAPQYRILLKYRKHLVEGIKPNLAEDKLDAELHRIMYSLERDIKEKGEKILHKDLKVRSEIGDYKRAYHEYLDQVNALGEARLAQYVVHRKTILRLLEKTLELGEDDRYALEEAVHELIFPMRTTSDEVDHDSQNLWVIDERLSFHTFLASDVRFDQMEHVEVAGGERPDLLIFNNAMAFADTAPPLSSVVIIEFKRPERKDYDDQSNPVTQVLGYIQRLREGKEQDAKGRTINIGMTTPFYSYIIADLTPKFVKILNDADYTAMPDSLGYYFFHKHRNAYIEVLSYTKLLQDAKRRNSVLFKKLLLPE